MPILRAWMRRVYCLFLNREDPRQGLKTILTAIEYVKSGVSIFIFPEEPARKPMRMLPFKEGSFKVATKTGCPIIRGFYQHLGNFRGIHVPLYPKGGCGHYLRRADPPLRAGPGTEKSTSAPTCRGHHRRMLKENENICNLFLK